MNGMDGAVTCVVTGGTSGIGREVALLLARRGAAVTIVGRNPERAAATVEDLRRAGARSAQAVLGDLSAQAEVRRIAAALLASHPRIDVLVNNAGGLFLRRRSSVDGVEMTWALNHLSCFLLTLLLKPRLVSSAPARVVTVASEAHVTARLRLDDPAAVTGAAAYGQSKLANVLFTRALARRLQGTGVTANAVHPGRVASGFGANNGLLWTVVKPFVHRRALSPEVAAPSVARLAIDASMAGISGRYFERDREVAPAPHAQDDLAAERLWTLSARMVGLELDEPSRGRLAAR
jgi:retinol dehydrogenase 12